MKSSPFFWAIALVGIVLWSGCGGDNPLNRQPVSGTVKIDGQPVGEGRITFVPTQGGAVMTGALIKDGHYEIPTEKSLAPGEYRVNLSAPDPNDHPKPISPGAPPPAPRDLIPPAYNTKSTQKVTVQASGANVFDFDIKTK